MKKSLLVISVVSLFVLISCQKTKTYKDDLQVHYENLEPQNIEVRNYAEALFSIDTSDFANGIKNIKDEYLVFLDGDLDNNYVIRYLKDFATDTFCVRINDMTKRKFSDPTQINKELKKVLQHFNYYYPEIKTPSNVYFYISGIDYNIPSVMIHQNGVTISLDFYLGNIDRIYDYVGMPRFRSLRCQPSYIARDLAQSLFDSYFEYHTQKNVLSEMVNVGKKLYFIEAMNPTLPDSVILGYSSKQMQWIKQHEADVWTYMVGENMLYSNDVEFIRTFFGDGPFTNMFSKESPARIGEFIGLQIVRNYMTNNNVSLQDLLKNNDMHEIFQLSKYKPRR